MVGGSGALGSAPGRGGRAEQRSESGENRGGGFSAQLTC